jgi:cellulose biosynthesis protein BcsQ
MYEVSNLKLKELQKIAQVSAPLLSRKFKTIEDEKLISRKNSRITGISPELVENYLTEAGYDHFYKGSVILTANLCGGCSKTSSTVSLSSSMRRLTNKPIILCDFDSQGSLSQSVCGSPASDEELILIDYLEGKASIKDIITEVETSPNTFIIKSNLNNAYLDKELSKPAQIKNSMKQFFEDLFELFGEEAKIFVDFPPQISNVFSSSISGLNQIDRNILKALIIPLRSDSFSINGGVLALKEYDTILETFNLENTISVHAFFSSVDRRIKATGEAMKLAVSSPRIAKHLCPVAIKYSSEVVKATMANTTIYKDPKGTAPADYYDLLNYIYSYDKTDEAIQ